MIELDESPLLGEVPPLPLDLVLLLHRRTAAQARLMTSRDFAASLFEGWRGSA